MSDLPFVLRAFRMATHADRPRSTDVLTCDDPLPASLEVNAFGYVVEHGTRVTEIKKETTDDN